MKFWFTNEDISKIGKDLSEILVETKMASSKSAARREIKSGAVRLNDVKIRDPFARLILIGNTFVVLQKEEFMEPQK